MDSAFSQVEAKYKELLEEETLEICEKVLEELTVNAIVISGIPYDSFVLAGESYIKDNNLPLDTKIIKNFIDVKIKEKDIKIVRSGNAYTKIANSAARRYFARCSHAVKDDNEERHNLIYTLTTFINFYEKRKMSIYTSFEELKGLLDDLGMNLGNQLSLFLKTIELNYSCFQNPNFFVYLPNYTALLKHKFKHITSKEMINLVKNDCLEKFLADENTELSDAQDELFEFMRSTSEDATDIQETCIKLYETMHKDVHTDEDNVVIRECLEKLSFSHLYYRLIKYLDNKADDCIEKGEVLEDNSEDNTEIPDVKPETEVKEIKKGPSQKERKYVYHEIEKIYDLENLKAKTTLSLDEIIYLLSMMYSIDMDESIITKFLESVMHQYQKNNPIAIYYQTQEKFARLMRDNSEIKEHQEMLAYILHDFNEVKGLSIFTCSDAEYIELKDLIAEEIEELMRLSEGNYTYEIERAECLLKINKGE